MDRFPKSIIVGGACLLGLTLAFGWGGLGIMIRGQIRKQVRLINNTDTYRYWKDYPVPIQLSIRFFNLSNGAELSSGAKPAVTEMGPYVYTVRLHKTDVVINDTTEDITYRQLKFYTFEPAASVGTEDDLITIPNVPLLGMARIAEGAPEGPELLKALDDLVSQKLEGLTRTHSVRELLFEGFSLQNYSGLFKEPEEGQPQGLKLPDPFTDDKFGFYRKKNGTDHGLFEIHNGRNKTYQFGEIMSWNDEQELKHWEEPCSKINGTDGIMFHPFLNESHVLDIYDPDYCRTISIVYNETVMANGIQAYRFLIAPTTFQGTADYRDNWCFCVKENSTTCDRNGVYELTPCHHGIPLLLSKPHFLDADPEIINGVNGIRPDPEQHDTFIDIHPMSGLPLQSARRFQYNIELMPYSGIPSLGEVPKAIVPIYWYQEVTQAPKKSMVQFMVFAWLQMVWDILKYGVLAVALMILGVGISLAMIRKSNDPDRIQLVK